VKLLLCYW